MYRDKEKQKEYARKHYLANKEKMIKRARSHSNIKVLKNKEYIDNYLKNHPCVDCGNSNILVLDFDHIKGIKKYNISDLKYSSLSIKTIDEEINKCEIRCANCHRIVTHNRKNKIDIK